MYSFLLLRLQPWIALHLVQRLHQRVSRLHVVFHQVSHLRLCPQFIRGVWLRVGIFFSTDVDIVEGTVIQRRHDASASADFMINLGSVLRAKSTLPGSILNVDLAVVTAAAGTEERRGDYINDVWGLVPFRGHLLPHGDE